MGKYSNIIFTDEENTIIDSIKRVPASMSSVREVLPGRKWFIPAQNKTNPLSIEDEADFLSTLSGGSSPDIVRALYGTFTGLSPAAAEEFVFEAGIDPRKTFPDLLPGEQSRLASAFLGHMERIRNGVFTPNIVLKNGEPVEFGVFPYRMYGDETAGSSSPTGCMVMRQPVRGRNHLRDLPDIHLSIRNLSHTCCSPITGQRTA